MDGGLRPLPSSPAGRSAERIVTLDLIRGIAVMGIFSVNIVGMAMVFEAYFYPPDYGFASLGDRMMWAANFVLVDGKFRSLFSILFGASLVLVCERAEVRGVSPWRAHYPRMIVLLGFGLAHYLLLFEGDILANYALVGMVVFAFWRLEAKQLLLGAGLLLGVYHLDRVTIGLSWASYWNQTQVATDPADRTAGVAEVLAYLHSTPAELAAAEAARASVGAHVQARIADGGWLEPFSTAFVGYGWETAGLMLLGMALYKSSFLGGGWSRRAYWLIGLLAVAGWAWFGFGAWQILAARFDPGTWFRWTALAESAAPLMAVGYAALLIVLVPRAGALGTRLAAVGRTAFSNYLGSSLIGVLLFNGYGLGLFGEVSRGEAWLFVPPVWAAMLLWAKPWLEHFRYGPFEWAWRCLSRGRVEPFRRSS